MISSKQTVITFGIILFAILVGVAWGMAIGAFSSSGLSTPVRPALLSPTAGRPEVAPTSILSGALEGVQPTTELSPSPTFTQLPAPTQRGPRQRTPTLSPTSTPLVSPVPATPSPTPASITYTVRPGDTLSVIAARFGTTVEALREANRLTGDLLRVGDELRIPITSENAFLLTATPTRAPTTPPTPRPSPTAGAAVPAYAPPQLVAPEDGASSALPITLRWSWSGTLGPDEYFDVRLWQAGQPHYGVAWTKTPEYVLNNPSFQGTYFWSVAVVRGQNGKWLADLSPEAPARQLTISAPSKSGSSQENEPLGPQPTPTR